MYLPLHVIRQQRQEYEALIWRNVTADDPLAQRYTVLLQQINPGMAIVKANDRIADATPLWPGYYHYLEKPVDAPMVVAPLTNDGAYAEPGDWIFSALARGNLRERRVRDELERQDRERIEAEEKRFRTLNEDRREKLKDIVKSATRAQVSMDRTIPWTQNSQGRRER